MNDQFRHLRPGEPLGGLPTRPWNKFLDRVLPELSDPNATGGKATTPIEVLIRNTTSSGLDAFWILGISGTLNPYNLDPDNFLAGDVVTGIAPTASTPIAIIQDGLATNGIGVARILGRAACRVNLTDISHRFANATPGSMAELTSAASGSVRIIAIENNFTATGSKWASVLLLGQSPGGGGSRFLRFTLAAALASTAASQAGCTVNDYWGSPDPGSTVTVWNLPASANFVFAGGAGAKGLATFDDIDGKWWIVQLECGSSGGGGITGFTGTIGD